MEVKDIDKDIKYFIINNIAECDYSKKLEILEQIKKSINDIEKEIRSNIQFCNKCKKYSEKEKWKVNHIKITQVETVCSDCGYGDDDIIGDVTSLISYDVCPYCGNEIYKDKIVLSINNERRRN